MLRQFIKHTPFGISLLVLFTAIAFLLLILPIFGNKTLIVRTGSMSPKIGVGDLIFVFPKPNYQAGDIIAFKEEGRGQTTITHRIAAVKTQNNQIFYQTKGDANKQADGTLVSKSSVLGSADYSIRGIGKIFAMVKTKNGFLLTAILPAALVIILELVNIVREFKKPKVYASSSVIPSPAFFIKRAGRGNLLNRLLRRQSQSAFFRSHPRSDRGSDTVLSQSKDSRFLASLRWRSGRENDTSSLAYGKPMGLNVPSASIQSFVSLILEKINLSSLKPSAGMPYYATGFRAFLPYAVVVVIFIGSTIATTYSDSEESAGNIFRAASAYPSPLPPSPSSSPESTPSASP